jgi:hypothetical protein
MQVRTFCLDRPTLLHIPQELISTFVRLISELFQAYELNILHNIDLYDEL